jgi:hypothetical protein
MPVQLAGRNHFQQVEGALHLFPDLGQEQSGQICL